jgi:hypothetical protein
MKIQLNVFHFLGSILSFIVAYLTVTGTIQNYIHFAGSLNEMAFAVISIMIGFILLISSIELPKKA